MIYPTINLNSFNMTPQAPSSFANPLESAIMVLVRDYSIAREKHASSGLLKVIKEKITVLKSELCDRRKLQSYNVSDLITD